jgi:hypothetical protein
MDGKSLQPRRFERYKVDLEVVIQGQGGPIPARITQISRGGCMVFPALPPQPTPFLRLSFRLSPELPPINCIGEIIYSIEERGTGISLAEISENNQDMISQHFGGQSPHNP